MAKLGTADFWVKRFNEALENTVKMVKEVRISITVGEDKGQYTFSGKEAIARIEKLIAKAQVTRIIVKNARGEVFISLPITAGATLASAAIVFASAFTLIATAVAWTAGCTVELEATAPKKKRK